MLAYGDLRRWWFTRVEERDEVNLQHAETGLPVMMSEILFVVGLYPGSLTSNYPDRFWVIVSAVALFFFSAIAGMQEHRVECAHFKTDILRAQQILKKFVNT